MIIGLTGTNAAGKTTTGRYLEKNGFVFHSLSDVLREELVKRKTEENLDTLISLGNSLRKEFGAGVLGKKMREKIENNREENSIVDSIRHPDEVKELKKAKNFVLFSIDAPIETRYQRTQNRKRAGDNISFEKFKQAEQFQMQGAGPEAQLLNCIALADYKIENNGSFEGLYKKIEEILEKMEK